MRRNGGADPRGEAILAPAPRCCRRGPSSCRSQPEAIPQAVGRTALKARTGEFTPHFTPTADPSPPRGRQRQVL